MEILAPIKVFLFVVFIDSFVSQACPSSLLEAPSLLPSPFGTGLAAIQWSLGTLSLDSC